MVEGKVYIGAGATTFFMGGGISSGSLTFKAAAWREQVVQETSEVFPGHYCDSCGAVTIETNRPGLSATDA
jgi:hypothetical protein